MVMSPLSVDFVADTLIAVGKQRGSGIIQISAEHDISYAEAAYHIAAAIGADAELVQPVFARDMLAAPESLARHTTMDTSRLQREFGIHPPGVWSAIDSAFRLNGHGER
jgi:dTDP-4-dehydrorhamnose reductase